MELVDIYNVRHELLDIKKDRKELVDGEYRLSAFIWIMNDNDEILIQQRLKTAKKCPNMWGTTAGGVKINESSLEGAIRELKEEMGIDSAKEELEFIGSYKRVNDFVEVYLIKKNIDIKDLKLQEDEVQDAKWVSIDEFINMVKDGIAINSGFDIFYMYYKEFYNKRYEFIDGKPVLVKK